MAIIDVERGLQLGLLENSDHMDATLEGLTQYLEGLVEIQTANPAPADRAIIDPAVAEQAAKLDALIAGAVPLGPNPDGTRAQYVSTRHGNLNDIDRAYSGGVASVTVAIEAIDAARVLVLAIPARYPAGTIGEITVIQARFTADLVTLRATFP